MQEKRKNQILKHMIELAKEVDERLDGKLQKIENITYYNDLDFKGSGLAIKNVYIVEIETQKQKETANKSGKINKSKEESTIYEIYNENNSKIATVNEKGKIHFLSEYTEKLKRIDERYFEQLNLENTDFELPKELSKNDISLTREELSSEKEKILDKEDRISEVKEKNDKEKKENQEEKKTEQETEEEKKIRTAKALEVDKNQIKSICTIDPNQRITDKYNLRDMMPESSNYKSISIAYTNQGNFTVLGVKSDGTREKINSIESIEGVATSKSVISINEDGSKVEEKQVKGLMRINARNRDDGIAISIGNYGMMNIDYVNNVMDKENRRSTPIRTMEAENKRIATAQVRENAGDSKEEMKREGRIYRSKQKNGVDLQTLNGIETDNMYGNITLDELKENIKEEALERGNMSKKETQEFIKNEIGKSGLELSEQEIENTVQEVEMEILDESRFTTRNERK